MKWELKNGLPIYQQLMQALCIGIANGTFPPGTRIPSVRELALEAGVNPNTMQRALAELEREGLLSSMRTSGRYVTEDERALSRLRDRLCSTYVRELCMNLRKLGLTDPEITSAVHQELAKESAGEMEEI